MLHEGLSGKLAGLVNLISTPFSVREDAYGHSTNAEFSQFGQQVQLTSSPGGNRHCGCASHHVTQPTVICTTLGTNL
jgi:hypothetical protein